MQGYVYLKRKLSGGSILSATIPAVTEEEHFGIFLLFRHLNLPPSCLGMSGSEDEAAPVTKAEFGRLLTAIAGIQDQMQSMKREILSHCTWVVKWSAWCMLSLNRSPISYNEIKLFQFKKKKKNSENDSMASFLFC